LEKSIYRQGVVGQSHGAAGVEVDQIFFGAGLLGERAVRVPGLQVGSVGSQQFSQQESLAAVGVSAALVVALANALNHTGGNDEDLNVITPPEEINKQIVRHLKGNQAILRCKPQFLALGIDLEKTIRHLGIGKLRIIPAGVLRANI
jgi:hypothetical protein